MDDLRAALVSQYGLGDVEVVALDTLVNDVHAVQAGAGRFALKLYHDRRSIDDVRWEAALVAHLVDAGAPVAPTVAGTDGEVVRRIGDRIGVLSEWAPGVKPEPSRETYLLLGATAARIHEAADTFDASPPRVRYDTDLLIDAPLQRMQGQLNVVGRWKAALALADRLKQRLAEERLTRGLCHIDLTLDNVHRDGDAMVAFDFDSAGECWRAFEPYGVLLFSADYFRDWLEGYRSVRRFSKIDEAAVATFAIVGDLRVVAWKLGASDWSPSPPLLSLSELPGVVDGWLALETSPPG